MREALKEIPLSFIFFNYYILDNVRDIYVYIYIYIYQSQIRIGYNIKITQVSWYLTAPNNRIEGKENTRIVIEIKTKIISNSCILLYNIKSKSPAYVISFWGAHEEKTMLRSDAYNF